MRALVAILPLVVFTLAEWLHGLTAGVIAAMACATLELGWHWRRHGRIDRMVLFSAALVIGLGGLSLLSADERFVRFTPVIGDVVFAGVLLATLWRDPPLMVALAARQSPELVDDAAGAAFVRGLQARLALNLLVHAGVTTWAALSADTPTWLFVSGPLQYVLFGLQLGFEIVYARLTLREAPSEPPTVGGRT